jgi:hypothetical protein
VAAVSSERYSVFFFFFLTSAPRFFINSERRARPSAVSLRERLLFGVPADWDDRRGAGLQRNNRLAQSLSLLLQLRYDSCDVHQVPPVVSFSVA